METCHEPRWELPQGCMEALDFHSTYLHGRIPFGSFHWTPTWKFGKLNGCQVELLEVGYFVCQKESMGSRMEVKSEFES